MKILVTGATGFTGGHLAQALVERGHKVRALVRPSANARKLAHAGVEIVNGDLRNAESVDKAMAGVDQVYHIAAAFRIAGRPDEFYREVNVGGTRNVLSAARHHGVERVMHCSTIGVHGDVGPEPVDETAPFNPGDIYQQTKLEAELLAAEAFRSDLRGVIFRPGAIYGPGDTRFLKLFKAIQCRRFVMLGSGEIHFHMVYIDDLVRGIILCGEKEKALGNVYILAGKRSVTINQLVKYISDIMRVRPPRFKIPLWPVSMAAHLCKAVCKPLNIQPPLYPRRADFFRNRRSFIIEKAKYELGYQPEVDLLEGLQRTAEWYVCQGFLKPLNRRPNLLVARG